MFRLNLNLNFKLILIYIFFFNNSLIKILVFEYYVYHRGYIIIIIVVCFVYWSRTCIILFPPTMENLRARCNNGKYRAKSIEFRELNREFRRFQFRNMTTTTLATITRVVRRFSLLNKTLVEFDQIARCRHVGIIFTDRTRLRREPNDLLEIYRVPINLVSSRVKPWLFLAKRGRDFLSLEWYSSYYLLYLSKWFKDREIKMP